MIGHELDLAGFLDVHKVPPKHRMRKELAKLHEEEILLHEACYAWGCLEYYASIATEEMEQELEERMKLLGYTFHGEEQIEAARAAINTLKAKARNWQSDVMAVAKRIFKAQDEGASPTQDPPTPTPEEK